MMNRLLIVLAFLLVAGCSANDSDSESRRYVKGYDEPVRGVWLTNVASDALFSRQNIREAVRTSHEMGINTIFVVTWNKGMTTYRSDVMESFTGVEIDPALDSARTGRDPLKQVIEEAHRYDMKVFAWFEFGFSSSYQAQGGKILEKKPGWALKNARGELVTKNGFDWMNALDPEVQNFMLSLVEEVVRNYDVDGIQGDDRLPAMPSEGGYNRETIEAYKEDHFGQAPPDYHKDFEWVHWRAEKLNDFMKRLYSKVQAVDSSCIVSMAPSVYPWSMAEYLQDWPTWVNFDYVDMIVPQVYRKDTASYRQTLRSSYEYILPEKRHLFYPGILLQTGDYKVGSDQLEYMMERNRQMGIRGEVFFFYEGMDNYKKEIDQYY
jgi:uncharacterized lipoprotein YddW (UPF0748 family)